MTLRTRLRALQRGMERLPCPADDARLSVFDRLDRLAVQFIEYPPVQSAAVEAGIAAAVDREERWAVPSAPSDTA